MSGGTVESIAGLTIHTSGNGTWHPMDDCNAPTSSSNRYHYHITGHVAHRRIAPLLTAINERKGGSDGDGDGDGGNEHRCAWVDFGHPVASLEPTITATTTATTKPSPPPQLLSSIAPVDFLWENAPRHDTKSWRNTVKCYSHLPNGTAILDSKWVLGRLLGGSSKVSSTRYSNSISNAIGKPNDTIPIESAATDDNDSIIVCDDTGTLAVLETHCYRGPTGFYAFKEKVKLWSSSSEALYQSRPHHDFHTETVVFRDLMTEATSSNGMPPTNPTFPSTCVAPNLWVVKDAHANGAGGIWVVGPDSDFALLESSTLTEGHWYVAQRYAWPPVLYRRRKCHVRVYALLTADGCAFVHRRCFVHVANDIFASSEFTSTSMTTTTTTTTDATTAADKHPYPDSVHITNCCTNSHDSDKFAGEICADLDLEEHTWHPSGSVRDADLTVGLRAFAPSIHSSVTELARRTFPFLQGGKANGGFEYMGLDFILSYRPRCPNEDGIPCHDEPIAYLLEVNAPPSQDTATGLPHAESLHDAVIRDLLTLWVIPNVTGAKAQRGGWHCVYKESQSSRTGDDLEDSSSDMILPSKAAILNRIRWTLFERKCLVTEAAKMADGAARDGDDGDQYQKEESDCNDIANFARTFFPYYSRVGHSNRRGGESSGPNPIYLENAGGTQVPLHVVDALVLSISCRNRSVHGKASVAAAKATMATVLGASSSAFEVYLGQNATSLLSKLAQRYIETGNLKAGDEIVISCDNHTANVKPWLRAAQMVGAIVKWWNPEYATRTHQPTRFDPTDSVQFKNLLSTKTRIVAVPHASNILGKLYDLTRLRACVDDATGWYGHIVADGVAAVPHRFADMDSLQLDWYVVSCHKLFGPHLGVLCGRMSTTKVLTTFPREVECGTMTHRTCNEAASAGIEIGTMNYEACEGVCGLGQYLAALSTYKSAPCDSVSKTTAHGDIVGSNLCLDTSRVVSAYRLIGLVEAPLMRLLLHGLAGSMKVRVVHGSYDMVESRLPLVCLVHDTVRCDAIVEHCRQAAITCRHGTFLSTLRLQTILQSNTGVRGLPTASDDWEVVRFSLSHYNTVSDVRQLLKVLASIPDWY